MIEVESSTGTSSAPASASGLGLVPASMMITGALIDRVPPSVRATSTVFGPVKWGLALDQVEPLLGQAAGVVLARAADHGPLALADRGQINRDRTGPDPEFRAPARRRATMMTVSDMSLRSQDSFLSIASRGSILSIGSAGSVLSIGSVGSALSIGSVGSTLSAFSVGSVLSVGSALSAASRWSLLSCRGNRDVLARRMRVMAALVSATVRSKD